MEVKRTEERVYQEGLAQSTFAPEEHEYLNEMYFLMEGRRTILRAPDGPSVEYCRSLSWLVHFNEQLSEQLLRIMLKAQRRGARHRYARRLDQLHQARVAWRARMRPTVLELFRESCRQQQFVAVGRGSQEFAFIPSHTLGPYFDGACRAGTLRVRVLKRPRGNDAGAYASACWGQF